VSSSQEPSVRNYPVHGDLIPDERIDRSRYSLRFATTPEELEAVQRLRFEVFNLELGEGLDESFATGRDEDRFDPVCHHLIVTDGEGNAVGTYRMQSSEMAAEYIGFYSADEFDLTGLPEEVLADAVEIGRACVAKPHRNRDVLFLLWIGLALYMTRNRKRYLFGCCSLTSQDPVLGKRVMDHLEAQGHVHPTIRIAPRPDWRCYPEPFDPGPSTLTDDVKLPKLFSLYLRYGAKACGSPALDRTFKTIDYLVLFDRDDLDAGHRAIFFG
jgi:putative hemolysin